MDLTKIEKFLEKEPSFRLKQAKKAIFQNLIENWEKITDLPQILRENLSKECPIIGLEKEKTSVSKDNKTLKVLFKLKNGLKIESVSMKHGSKSSPQASRNTVCVSSQVGCAMGCQFCATGQQGFKRNLTSGEIIDQVLFFARLLKKKNEKITNVVFMGTGEPFLNYDNVIGAVKALKDKEGFNLGSRHFSISTAGIAEGIEKLAKEKLQVNLAVSLHAPTNLLRSKLMPINKIYPIEKILLAVDDYIEKTGRKVMFEYLMIDGVNDSGKEAEKLAKIMKKPLYFVNFIAFNPVGHSDFKPSPGWKIKKFKEILEKKGVSVTQRYRFGREIKAACGQLAGEKQ